VTRILCVCAIDVAPPQRAGLGPVAARCCQSLAPGLAAGCCAGQAWASQGPSGGPTALTSAAEAGGPGRQVTVDNIDEDTFASGIRGGMFQPADQNLYQLRCATYELVRAGYADSLARPPPNGTPRGGGSRSPCGPGMHARRPARAAWRD